MTATDLQNLVEGLGLAAGDVVTRYCRLVDVGGGRQVSLAEQENLDCVFWRDGSCVVYEYRPVQCRTFPFWSHNLESRADWDRVAAACPGTGIGELHSVTEIDRLMAIRTAELPLRDRDVPGGRS